MEYDRYQQNKALFIIGMISLIASMGLLAFSFYIIPALLWNWWYYIPEQVFVLREYIKEYYNCSQRMAGVLSFFVFFIPAIFMGIVSYFASNKIENQIYIIEEELIEPEEKTNWHMRETFSGGLKLLILALLVVLVVLFAQWLISEPG